MNSHKINIHGMHCRSCEILIKEELQKIQGIKKVSVNHRKGVAHVHCDCELDHIAVTKAVEDAGYHIGTGEKPSIFSRDRKAYADVGIAFFIVFALFLLAKMFGLFDLVGSVSGDSSSLPVVFLIGLTAGVSTCMALVGGLVLGTSARFAEKNPKATGREKFKPHLFFNLGRIASYFILGGIIGFAGSLFQLSTSILGLLTVIVGLVMLLLGGQLIEIFPVLKKISFTLPTRLHRWLGIKEKSNSDYSNTNALILGALTFFLPCGFTQAMQLYAMSTGSVWEGALIMGVFALGTAPGLLGVGGLTSMVKGRWQMLFFKTAGVVVILLALFNISNGLNLLGVTSGVLGSSTSTDKAAGNDPYVTLVNGIQEVRMAQNARGYTPNIFTIKNGIPVTWIIDSKDNYSCASSIVSQKIGVRQNLTLGKNIIKFTPTEVGSIRFSCSMGMYTGSFTVVANN